MYEKEDKRAMDLALITAKQVFELFILILCGVVIGKIKMVFYSILTICIGMALSIGITFLMKKEVRGIIRFATTFSNAAYMGFPLIQAMYGSEGVLYASVYVTVFNILLWTVGIVYVSESMSFKELLKKIVTCPPIISVAVGLVIFLARIPVADVLKDTFNVVGGMNTPLSMIITGITISQFPLLSILKDKRVYFTVILRMFIIPVICTLVMYLPVEWLLLLQLYLRHAHVRLLQHFLRLSSVTTRSSQLVQLLCLR